MLHNKFIERTGKRNYLQMIFYAFLFTILFSQKNCYAQEYISGLVKNKKDSTAILFASIGVKNRNAGCVADSLGKFLLKIPPSITQSDTLIISAIGYKNFYTKLDEITQQKIFYLEPTILELSDVVIVPIRQTLEVGNIPKHRPSFSMGWGNDGQGGEAGNVFILPIEKYQILKILTRISTTYDTCWFRLHIRKIENEIPGQELLQENIIVVSTLQEGVIEFNIPPRFNIFSTKEIFVGFELLKHSIKGSKSANGRNYMVYEGSEPGKFKSFHKWYSNSTWEKGKEHSFSIKLLIKK